MAVGSGWKSDKVFCQNPLVCQLSAFKNFSRQARKSFFEAVWLEVRQPDAMRALRAFADKPPAFFEAKIIIFDMALAKSSRSLGLSDLSFAFSLKSQRNIWTDVRCSLWQQFPDPDNNAKLLHSTSQFAFQILISSLPYQSTNSQGISIPSWPGL